jgi:hypothetical protein
MQFFPWLAHEPCPDVFTFGPNWTTNVTHAVKQHSPSGLAWGYYGSGPLDTSLNILGLFLPEVTARRLHFAFCREHIAWIPQDQDAILRADTVRDWIMRHVHILPTRGTRAAE